MSKSGKQISKNTKSIGTQSHEFLIEGDNINEYLLFTGTTRTVLCFMNLASHEPHELYRFRLIFSLMLHYV